MKKKYDLSSLGAQEAEKNNPKKTYDLSALGATSVSKGPQSQQQMSPLEAEGQYLKGIGQGALEKGGQFGASTLNAPTAAWEYFGGKPLYEHFNAPYHPSQPTNAIQASGQRMGPGVTELAAMTPPLKAAGLISKVPEGASLLARLLQSGKKIGTVGTAGAAEGLLFGEPNRAEEAKKIGLGSAELEGIGQLISKGLSYRPSSKFKKAEKEYQLALSNQQEQENALKQAKGIAKEETGLNTPEAITPRIETRNKEISDALNQINELPTEEFLSTVTHKAHTQLEKRAEDNLKKTNEAISEAMGAGQNPDKPLAQNVEGYFEGKKNPETGLREGGLQQEIGNEFNQVRDELGGKKFQLEQAIDERQIRQMAEAAVKKNLGEQSLTEENIKRFSKAIKDDIKNNGGNIIDAQTFYDTYRSLDHEIGEEIYYLKKNKGQLSTNEIKAQRQKIAEMQSSFHKMEHVIEKQSSPEIIERLNKAKYRWANEYVPLRSDPIYRKMINKNIIDSKDIMDAIRGEDKSSLILRHYFQSNPKAAELLAKYQFAENPMGLQQLTPYQQEFINPKLTPQISKIMEQQKNAITNVDKAKAQQAHFEELSQSIKDAQKQHNEQLSERQKLEKQIPQWKAEIEKLSKHEALIKKQMENKQLNKEQVELKKAEMERAKARKDKITKYMKKAIKYGGIAEYLHLHNKR